MPTAHPILPTQIIINGDEIKMSEREILNAIKENVTKQESSWKFVAGREIYDKEAFLEKLDVDEQFQKTIVRMVVDLSIDILSRKPE